MSCHVMSWSSHAELGIDSCPVPLLEVGAQHTCVTTSPPARLWHASGVWLGICCGKGLQALPTKGSGNLKVKLCSFLRYEMRWGRLILSRCPPRRFSSSSSASDETYSSRIRNLSICAHVDAGKSSLSECVHILLISLRCVYRCIYPRYINHVRLIYVLCLMEMDNLQCFSSCDRCCRSCAASQAAAISRFAPS